MFSSAESFAWTLLIVSSVLALMEILRVIRLRYRSRSALADAEAALAIIATSEVLSSPTPRLGAFQATASAVEMLKAVAAGSSQGLPCRVAAWTADAYGLSSVRGLNTAGRLAILGGLAGTIYGVMNSDLGGSAAEGSAIGSLTLALQSTFTATIIAWVAVLCGYQIGNRAVSRINTIFMLAAWDAWDSRQGTSGNRREQPVPKQVPRRGKAGSLNGDHALPVAGNATPVFPVAEYVAEVPRKVDHRK